MKVLMISTDAHILDLQSKECKRMESYASLTDELHIIVCTKGGNRNTQKVGNMFLYPTNSFSKLFYGLGVLRIAKRLRGKGITVVTAQDPFEIGLVAESVARKLGAGFEVQIHTDLGSPYFKKQSLLNRVRIAIAHRVLLTAKVVRVVSERIKKELERDYKLGPEFKLNTEIAVIPVALDLQIQERLVRSDFLQKKYPQFKTILLMVSRLESEKNIPLALYVLKELVVTNPGLGLVIVGAGRERGNLVTLAKNLGLKEKVVFEGRQDMVTPYFESADIFLNTSNYEGYGRTILEAAISGCPVLTTDVGIAGEVFSGDTITITKVDDVADFKQQLAYMLLHNEECVAKATKALEIVTHYVERAKAERLLRIKDLWQKAEQ
jgi:1,2-diacylglycerol 3-alpha-glucosyltransferase